MDSPLLLATLSRQGTFLVKSVLYTTRTVRLEYKRDSNYIPRGAVVKTERDSFLIGYLLVVPMGHWTIVSLILVLPRVQRTRKGPLPLGIVLQAAGEIGALLYICGLWGVLVSLVPLGGNSRA